MTEADRLTGRDGPATSLRIEIDADGAAATRRAQAGEGRTAVWVGAADDPALDAFRAELCR